MLQRCDTESITLSGDDGVGEMGRAEGDGGDMPNRQNHIGGEPY